MTLALPALEPGAYEVRWTTLSAEDGELARGTTSFTFTPPPPTPTPVPTPTPAPSATPAPTPSPDALADRVAGAIAVSRHHADDARTVDVLLPIIVAVLVIAGLAYWLTRRRSGSGSTP